MVRYAFTCPETGEPLRLGMPFEAAPAGEPEPRLALHCPKCGHLHSFARSQASVAIEPEAPVGAA